MPSASSKLSKVVSLSDAGDAGGCIVSMRGRVKVEEGMRQRRLLVCSNPPVASRGCVRDRRNSPWSRDVHTAGK